MPNDADIIFEMSVNRAFAELDDIRKNMRQVSPGYKAAQTLELDELLQDLTKLIDEWGRIHHGQ